MPRHSSRKSREPVAGAWSAWNWDESRREYYRARIDVNGNWEYEFNPGGAAEPEVSEEVDDPLDDLPENLESLNIREEDPEPLTQHPARGKGKNVLSPDDPDEPEELEPEGYGSDHTELAPEDVEDPVLENLKRQSALSGREGEPSGSGSYHEESAYGIQPDEDTTEALPVDEDGTIVTGVPLVDALDPRYRVERSHRWTPGTVFKIYWSEPMGASGALSSGALSVSNKQMYTGEFGSFYTGFRRFIVVATDEGHSTCVPVATYGGKGCKKHGVKASKHGIIYAYNTKSRTIDGEPRLGFPSVRMKFTADGEKLAPASRVNYSKLITIEHNCKVFFIGHIHKRDFDIVQDAVDSCWGVKQRHTGYLE